MQEIKCVLHYLKHTLSHGLQLVWTTTLHLATFYDTDWKSTTAYIVYLGPNVVS